MNSKKIQKGGLQIPSFATSNDEPRLAMTGVLIHDFTRIHLWPLTHTQIGKIYVW